MVSGVHSDLPRRHRFSAYVAEDSSAGIIVNLEKDSSPRRGGCLMGEESTSKPRHCTGAGHAYQLPDRSWKEFNRHSPAVDAPLHADHFRWLKTAVCNTPSLDDQQLLPVCCWLRLDGYKPKLSMSRNIANMLGGSSAREGRRRDPALKLRARRQEYGRGHIWFSTNPAAGLALFTLPRWISWTVACFPICPLGISDRARRQRQAATLPSSSSG